MIGVDLDLSTGGSRFEGLSQASGDVIRGLGTYVNGSACDVVRVGRDIRRGRLAGRDGEDEEGGGSGGRMGLLAA